MKTEAAHTAALLLRDSRVAALGTLHDGAPAVSMVPYALVPDPFALIVLVSALATHTRDMAASPRVGVLVTAAPAPDRPAHTLARVALEARAVPLAADDPRHAAARRLYAGRFPDMAMLFELGDFSLVLLEPLAVRAVLGFAQAHSLSPAALAQAIAALPA
jgi:hypothetical protein